MMKPTLKHALLAVALATSMSGLSGCASKEPKSPFPHAERPADAANIKIEAKASGDDSNLKLPAVSVVNTQAGLTAVGGEAAKLTVDFEKQMVVILALGKQNSSGFWARITEVYSSPGVLWVEGVANRPAGGAVVETKITFPYAAVVIAKTEGVIVSDITSGVGLPSPTAIGAPAASPAPAKPVAKPAAKAAKPAPAKPATTDGTSTTVVKPAPAPADKPAAAPTPESPVAPTPPAAKEAPPSSTTPPARVEEPMK